MFFIGHLREAASDIKKTFNSKQICSLNQYCWHAIFDG